MLRTDFRGRLPGSAEDTRDAEQEEVVEESGPWLVPMITANMLSASGMKSLQEEEDRRIDDGGPKVELLSSRTAGGSPAFKGFSLSTVVAAVTSSLMIPCTCVARYRLNPNKH